MTTPEELKAKVEAEAEQREIWREAKARRRAAASSQAARDIEQDLAQRNVANARRHLGLS